MLINHFLRYDLANVGKSLDNTFGSDHSAAIPKRLNIGELSYCLLGIWHVPHSYSRIMCTRFSPYHPVPCHWPTRPCLLMSTKGALYFTLRPPIHPNPLIAARCYIRLWRVISTEQCSIPHPTRTPSNPIHPLLAYSATSVYESGMCTLSTQNLDDTHWLQRYIIQSVDCPLRLFFFSPWSIQALCTCCLICPPGISCPHENRNILPTYKKTGISCLQENRNIQALCIYVARKSLSTLISPPGIQENKNILPSGIK